MHTRIDEIGLSYPVSTSPARLASTVLEGCGESCLLLSFDGGSSFSPLTFCRGNERLAEELKMAASSHEGFCFIVPSTSKANLKEVRR